MKTSEHRKVSRKRCRVPVDGKEDSIYGDVYSVDISKRGLGLISKRKIAINQKIAVEVDLAEGQEPIFVLGQVRWVQRDDISGNYHVGMKFIKVLSSGSRSRLTKYFGRKA